MSLVTPSNSREKQIQPVRRRLLLYAVLTLEAVSVLLPCVGKGIVCALVNFFF